MLMDQPVIDYDYKKHKGRRSMMATKGEMDELDRLSEQWAGRRNGRTFVGKEFDLEDFLQQKV